MNEVLMAFGRGVVKVLISLFTGTGVGLVTFGLAVPKTEDIWRSYGPPAGFFLGLGAGLLTTAGMMVVLFFLPMFRREPTVPPGKPVQPADWAP
jgi:hypothetical protein